MRGQPSPNLVIFRVDREQAEACRQRRTALVGKIALGHRPTQGPAKVGRRHAGDGDAVQIGLEGHALQRRIAAERSTLYGDACAIADAIVEHKPGALDDVLLHPTIAEIAIGSHQIVAAEAGRAAEIGLEHGVTAIGKELGDCRVARRARRPRSAVHADHQWQGARIATGRKAQKAVQTHAVGCGPADWPFARQLRRGWPLRIRIAVQDLAQFAAVRIEDVPPRLRQPAVALGDQPVSVRAMPDLDIQIAVGQPRLQSREFPRRLGAQTMQLRNGTSISRQQRLAADRIGDDAVEVGLLARVAVQHHRFPVAAEALQDAEVAATIRVHPQGVIGSGHTDEMAALEFHATRNLDRHAARTQAQDRVALGFDASQVEYAAISRKRGVTERQRVAVQHGLGAIGIDAQQSRQRLCGARQALRQHQQRGRLTRVDAHHFVKHPLSEPGDTTGAGLTVDVEHRELIGRHQEQAPAVA